MERPEEVTRFLRCGGMNCDCSCGKGGKVEDCLTWRVHGYVEELEAQVPKWISVEERLPEVDKSWTDKYTDSEYRYSADLLVYDGIRLRVAYYCHTTTWWYDSRYEDDIIEVTHWMPLPEPPKEVTS